MTTIIICVLTLFSSLIIQENKNIEHRPFKFSIEISDTVYKGQYCIPIILKVENITCETMTLSNPAHWGNSLPYLKQGGRDIPMIKIKVNPRHLRDTIQIKGGEIYRTDFDYPLDKIVNFDFFPPGKYEMFFQLQLKGNETLKSNVVTFYKE